MTECDKTVIYNSSLAQCIHKGTIREKQTIGFMFIFLPLSFANEPPPPLLTVCYKSFLQVGAIAALDLMAMEPHFALVH